MESKCAVVEKAIPNRDLYAPNAKVMQITNDWPRQSFPEPLEKKS
jgi:hypothetical protein